ncbi:MAG: iron-containing alcohol dehydrogenase [Dehalococcoidales bacterium]|nr:iron-containing alcohol dehydrogenase [Dehalococcoidales bacterium]
MTIVSYRIFMPQTIIFGVDTLKTLSDETKILRAKNALIVSDPGVFKSGLVTPVKEQLLKTLPSVEIYPEVEPEPTLNKLNATAVELHKRKFDLIIGLGGGSSLDTAKGLSVLLAHGGKIQDYIGVDKVPGSGIPLVLIPTTAGTGSEVTNIAIFSDTEQELKRGMVSRNILARIALVDPTLTYGCPSAVSAASGIDSLVHAIECFTSLKANDYTDALAVKAMELIISSLRTVVKSGADKEARKCVSEGALLAGIAFANAGVAAVHAMAYPLGAKFHISHGVANGLLLPYVMECNLTASLQKYAIIARLLGEKAEGISSEELAQRGVTAVKALVKDIGIPGRLRDINVPRETLECMAKSTMEVTRLLENNPRKLTLDDVRGIWQKAW